MFARNLTQANVHSFQSMLTWMKVWCSSSRNDINRPERVFAAVRRQKMCKVELAKVRKSTKNVLNWISVTLLIIAELDQFSCIVTYLPQRRIQLHNISANGPTSTRGSAIAEEPRDALRQLKYYGRFWLSNWQEVLLIQRNHASTLSVEIVYNAAQMFDGLHVKTSAKGEWPSRSFKVTAVATIW